MACCCNLSAVSIFPSPVKQVRNFQRLVAISLLWIHACINITKLVITCKLICIYTTKLTKVSVQNLSNIRNKPINIPIGYYCKKNRLHFYLHFKQGSYPAKRDGVIYGTERNDERSEVQNDNKRYCFVPFAMVSSITAGNFTRNFVHVREVKLQANSGLGKFVWGCSLTDWKQEAKVIWQRLHRMHRTYCKRR